MRDKMQTTKGRFQVLSIGMTLSTGLLLLSMTIMYNDHR
jgi:hypothetical protein